MEQAYFAGLKFRDLAEKLCKKELNFANFRNNFFSRIFNFAIFFKSRRKSRKLSPAKISTNRVIVRPLYGKS